MATKKEQEAEAQAQRTMDDILEDITKSESAEEVLSGGALAKAEDNLDTPLTVTGFRMTSGDFGDYAIFETDEVGPISCGSQIVVTQLRQLEKLGAFPVRVSIRSNSTKRGWRALRLVTVE